MTKLASSSSACIQKLKWNEPLVAIGTFLLLLNYGTRFTERFFGERKEELFPARLFVASAILLSPLVTIKFFYEQIAWFGACLLEIMIGTIFGGIIYLLAYHELGRSPGSKKKSSPWDKPVLGAMALLALIVGFLGPYAEVWLNSLEKLEIDWFKVNLAGRDGSSSFLLSLREAESQIENKDHRYAEPIWIKALANEDKKYYRVLNEIETIKNPTSTKYAAREQAIEDFSAFFGPSEEDEISLMKVLETIKKRNSSYRDVNFVRTTMGPLAFSLRRFLETFRSEKNAEKREKALDDLALSIMVSYCIADNFHGAWEKCRDDEEWRNKPSYESLKGKLSIVAKSLKRNEDRPPYLYLLLNALELRAGNKEGAYPAISKLPCQEKHWNDYEGKCNKPGAWIEEDINIHYWGTRSLQLFDPYWKPKNIYRKYNKMRTETEKVCARLEDCNLCGKVVDSGEICKDDWDAVEKRFRRARMLAWNGWAYYLAWTGEAPRDAVTMAEKALEEAKDLKKSDPSRYQYIQHMYQDTVGFAILADALKRTYYPKEKNKKLREAKGLFESAIRGIEEMEEEQKQQYPFTTKIYKLHLGAVNKLLGTINRDE
uniref:Uncharacterized protein n=1 Tax=Candidatus Kentrum sp. UNK TaxID=2126344 RepID=A0A451ATX4_9GAMM|nr:MAG: hypothetical protein BECKUNK1418G_GA0071005_101338 [Candidatus Kentron sp. UNK]VFK69490.1 MAG: hypothetical protein BECKUNK1418H_GA0071006_101438 [Candidatus Kentron sp. UNK]